MSEHELRDEAVKALLRAETPAPPFDDIDWPRLHARIAARTAPLIRGRGTAWWLYLAGWSRRTVVGGAVAAAFAVLLLVQTVRPDPSAGDAAEFRIVEEVLADAMLAEALPLLLPATDETMDALLFNETER